MTMISETKTALAAIAYGFRWRVFNKTTVSVKWPRSISLRSDPTKFKDPNPIGEYRSWLEENIGVEDKDWAWFVDWAPVDERVVIRLHNKHKAQATMIGLMWA